MRWGVGGGLAWGQLLDRWTRPERPLAAAAADGRLERAERGRVGRAVEEVRALAGEEAAGVEEGRPARPEGGVEEKACVVRAGVGDEHGPAAGGAEAGEEGARGRARPDVAGRVAAECGEVAAAAGGERVGGEDVLERGKVVGEDGSVSPDLGSDSVWGRLRRDVIWQVASIMEINEHGEQLLAWDVEECVKDHELAGAPSCSESFKVAPSMTVQLLDHICVHEVRRRVTMACEDDPSILCKFQQVSCRDIEDKPLRHSL